ITSKHRNLVHAHAPQRPGDEPGLHSFPTRRSSDLSSGKPGPVTKEKNLRSCSCGLFTKFSGRITSAQGNALAIASRAISAEGLFEIKRDTTSSTCERPAQRYAPSDHSGFDRSSSS